MFTRTSDCLMVGNLKHSSKEIKTIPSVQFDCEVDGQRFQIMVLASKFNSPVVRLTLEALYVAGQGNMSELELRDLVLRRVPEARYNDEELKSILHEIRAKRVSNHDREISLTVSIETISDIFKLMYDEGNLSFSCELKIEHAILVDSFDDITEEYIRNIYQDQYDEMMSHISAKDEVIGISGRCFYPEDCFINRGILHLEYLNSISGGQFDGYHTLKHAYKVNDHFRENPDFFWQTHCSCGAELVVRHNGQSYTLMSCINPYCYEKIAYALNDFARDIGAVGLGPNTLLQLAKYYSLENLKHNGDCSVNYRMVLTDDAINHLGDQRARAWIDFMQAIREYNGTLADLINILGLPYIGGDAVRILTKDVIERQDLTPAILAYIGQTKGKHDKKFILNLWFMLEDIKYVVFQLAKSLNREVVEDYLIYITQSVLLEMDDGTRSKYTKAQFEKLVNDALEAEGIKNFRIKVHKSLTHKCNALIADMSRETGSCRTAESYGIPIYTSREFLEMLGGKGE